MTHMGKIVGFRPEYSVYFRQLNLEWLEELFYVEPHDREILEQCEELIINRGGHIFFYVEQDVVMGTFALVRLDDGVFELAKMAVSKTSRGKGIGQQMIRFCIDFSKKQKWKKLLLYSNTSLENSIYLYEKYGFKEVPLTNDNPYARGNIKMELIL